MDDDEQSVKRNRNECSGLFAPFTKGRNHVYSSVQARNAQQSRTLVHSNYSLERAKRMSLSVMDKEYKDWMKKLKGMNAEKRRMSLVDPKVNGSVEPPTARHNSIGEAYTPPPSPKEGSTVSGQTVVRLIEDVNAERPPGAQLTPHPISILSLRNLNINDNQRKGFNTVGNSAPNISQRNNFPLINGSPALDRRNSVTGQTETPRRNTNPLGLKGLSCPEAITSIRRRRKTIEEQLKESMKYRLAAVSAKPLTRRQSSTALTESAEFPRRKSISISTNESTDYGPRKSIATTRSVDFALTDGIIGENGLVRRQSVPHVVTIRRDSSKNLIKPILRQDSVKRLDVTL